MLQSAPAKNFGLQFEQFEDLVNRLKAGDETLFQTIFLAHFEDCMNYLKHKFSVSHEQAYDVTMETLLQFRVRLLDGKIGYGNIRFLFTQMASQLCLKQLKSASPISSDQIPPEIGLPEEGIDHGIIEVLNKAWGQLGNGCRHLLKRFYYEKASLKEIAQEQRKAATALRKQKQRCIEKLRLHFRQLYQI